MLHAAEEAARKDKQKRRPALAAIEGLSKGTKHSLLRGLLTDDDPVVRPHRRRRQSRKLGKTAARSSRRSQSMPDLSARSAQWARGAAAHGPLFTWTRGKHRDPAACRRDAPNHGRGTSRSSRRRSTSTNHDRSCAFVPNFVIQGGDPPQRSGGAGPGLPRSRDEINSAEVHGAAAPRQWRSSPVPTHRRLAVLSSRHSSQARNLDAGYTILRPRREDGHERRVDHTDRGRHKSGDDHNRRSEEVAGALRAAAPHLKKPGSGHGAREKRGPPLCRWFFPSHDPTTSKDCRCRAPFPRLYRARGPCPFPVSLLASLFAIHKSVASGEESICPHEEGSLPDSSSLAAKPPAAVRGRRVQQHAERALRHLDARAHPIS